VHRPAQLLGGLVETDAEIDPCALFGRAGRGRRGRLPSHGIPHPGAVERGSRGRSALYLALAVELA
jgi:hypothetical protein